jgi:tryptophan 2,3-dioxygenase
VTIRRYIEHGVETFEADIDGERISWDAGLTYARHLQTEALLNAQSPVSDQPDELLFIIMHQTMELWIKLMIHELALAIGHVRSGKLDLVGKTLDRVAAIQRHMIQSWEVLATLTPHDFLTFRGDLGKASGFQSHQYRALEFLLGAKRAELLLVHAGEPEIHARLSAVLGAPSLYDEVLRLLHRRGFAIPASHLDRDWSRPYAPASAVEDAWLSVYADPRAHWDLYMLGEKLTGLEYYFQEWRFKHMKTVSRVIGHAHGTGGSSGVNYLIKALDLSFFPELWSMRTRMSAARADHGAAPAPAEDPR